MAQSVSWRSRKGYGLLVVIGLPVLLVLLFLLWLKSKSQKSTILSVLRSAGVDSETAKMWVAVSAFETAGWTSRVYMDSHNLFCIKVPGTNRLAYGEGQTIYNSDREAVKGLVGHVIKPFDYPLTFKSIWDLVSFMKSKKYFQSDLDDYYAGVSKWYIKLFKS